MRCSMPKKFQIVGVGGTFDELHRGHEALLLRAFELGQRVIIGVASDDFVGRMGKPHATSSYKERVTELESFLKGRGFLQRANIRTISDAYGGLLLPKDPIRALIVSRETEPMAHEINRKRREMGLPLLTIVVVDMVPSENHAPISTTRIRRGEIDREGHLLETCPK
jgi:cytidyltransferase-like protein